MLHEVADHPRAQPATQSNYHDIVTEHLHLEWSVDWKEPLISGSVQHTMVAKKPTSVAVFDSSYLDIKSVSTASGTALTFDLPPRHKVLGSALKVDLPHELKEGEKVEIIIEYSTTAECTALGWLTAEQTASKLYPFFYSQCQAIHGRSLIPLQDTPAVKATYSASVQSPLPILMSALGVSPSREEISSTAIDVNVARTYSYTQKVRFLFIAMQSSQD